MFVIPTLTALALLVAFAVFMATRPSVNNTPARVPEPPTSSLQSTARPEYAKLLGRWARSDGDYIIEIKDIGADGRMDAAYFNPSPINIGKAEASTHAGTAKVYVQLQDANYPGSAYTLLYDAATDQLKGTYFQAVEQQTFDVTFTRLP